MYEDDQDFSYATDYIQSEHVNGLNIIHVAGTKGKGSTCAFTESFLRAHGTRTGYPRKTGLYTSPHLLVPEERIRINGQPLQRSSFAKYLFEVYDKLPQLSHPFDPHAGTVEQGPRTLQLFALLAFHVFVREGVDVAIIETHHGGEYDATNVVEKPVVTAITTLGMDHVEQLGPNIENIAWHKAGIFKPGAVALSAVQGDGPSQVLRDRAEAKDCDLRIVAEDARLPTDAMQLKVDVQEQNAALAAAAAEEFIRREAPSTSLTAEDIRIGVQQWSWPGRFEIISQDKITWCLDAAHNELSVVIAAKWFSQICRDLDSSATRMLIFSHISENRNPGNLLRTLAQALRDNGTRTDHVVFTTYEYTSVEKPPRPQSVDTSFHTAWKDIFPESQIHEGATISAALDRVTNLSRGAPGTKYQILITGSQHLVGPARHTLQHDQPRSLGSG